MVAAPAPAPTPAADTTGYWQQRVIYQIAASLDEPTGVLTGHVRIDYTNQSRDTLRDFFVHQYLNAFRPGSRWAAADARAHRERFKPLREPDYAFERNPAWTVYGGGAPPGCSACPSMATTSEPPGGGDRWGPQCAIVESGA